MSDQAHQIRNATRWEPELYRGASLISVRRSLEALYTGTSSPDPREGECVAGTGADTHANTCGFELWVKALAGGSNDLDLFRSSGRLASVRNEKLFG